LKTSM